MRYLFILLICAGCSTARTKHVYVEYGQTAYIHSPTDKPGQWMTFEVTAPKFKDVE